MDNLRKTALFTFTKKASIVVNSDVDISHLFTRLAGAILNLPHDIRDTGLFLQIIQSYIGSIRYSAADNIR